MQGPGGFVLTFPLEDDGYGYPDVTGSDGLYTGTLPKFSHQPGKRSSEQTQCSTNSLLTFFSDCTQKHKDTNFTKILKCDLTD
jgi:hypothetical protein